MEEINWNKIVKEKTIEDYISEYEEIYNLKDKSADKTVNAKKVSIETLTDVEVYMVF